jgi:hypothetical protein
MTRAVDVFCIALSPSMIAKKTKLEATLATVGRGHHDGVGVDLGDAEVTAEVN